MKRLLVAVLAIAGIACGSATPTPGPVGPRLTIPQLKFRVIDSVGVPVYCDPDIYPIARDGGEQANAIAKFPQIQADKELYTAIIGHEHLSETNVNDLEKLVIYRSYKLLNAIVLTPAGDSYAFQVRVRSNSGTASYLLISGVVRIDGEGTINTRTPTSAPNCPICLAAATVIATPNGPVRVTDIRLGMAVWTAAADGTRVVAAVVATGSMDVPAGHLMVHLVLADGRELLASPGHRTADGRQLGALAVGDSLDGATIRRWELTPYLGDRTYDLLPAGPSGTYWANGIRLSSTLAAHQLYVSELLAAS
jgi:hypothetical protein